MGYRNDTGYPSVTDVLSPYIDKRWFKDIHRKRGNEVHRVMSCVCSGAWSIPINAAWAGYVKSISLWLSKNVKEFLLVETRYSDDVYKYTGKLDLVAILKDERKALLDFKTSVAEYKTWKLQTAAYKLLYTKNNPKERPIDITMAVRGREDGSKPALVNEYHDFENDSRRFLYANDLYHTLIK
jgi:hypothetical protein